MDSGISNEHGDGRDHFEINEGLDAEAANLLEIRVAGNPDHKNTEEQRRDDDLDEAEKDVAQNSKMLGKCRRIEAKFETGEHRDEDPERERPPANCGVSQCKKAEAAKDEEDFVTRKE